MRVTIVSRIYRPEPAAASQALGAVADALTEAGHEVTVLTAAAPRALQQQPRVGRERVRTFPVLRDAQGYVRGYLQYLSFDIPLAFRLLFARRPQVVFVEPPPTTGAVTRVICTLRRIPYVYDAADLWSDAAAHATSSPFVIHALRWVERFAMRGARARVTISQGVVDRAQEIGIASPFTVTGFGADTTDFFYTPATPNPLFVYAGTYSELHGADILLPAFAELLRTHPTARLRFLGNGTQREQLEKCAAALGIAAAVEFRDPEPPSALRTVLAGATASLATLLPGGGYDYAFTSKVYSSLACGCPAIFAGPGPTAAFLRAAPETLRVGAAVEYTSGAIAAAMREHLEAPATPEEREALADWTREHHSLRRVAERITEVLELAAGVSHPHHPTSGRS